MSVRPRLLLLVTTGALAVVALAALTSASDARPTAHPAAQWSSTDTGPHNPAFADAEADARHDA